MNQENINALASKKDKEQHVFKVKDMENLEDVFIQMLGRKISEGCKEVRKLPRSPKVTHNCPGSLEGSHCSFSVIFSSPGTMHFLILESQSSD